MPEPEIDIRDVRPEPGPEPEPQVTPEPEPTPHPLEPGGPRFEEVYGQMKEYRRRLEQIEAERAQERAAMAAAQVRPPQPTIQQYTPDQVADYLQQRVDRGEITPMQASNALSQFNAQRVATATAIQVEQQRAFNAQLQEAANEVQQYIAKVPALRDTNSEDFRKVSEAANRVSRRLGLPVTDYRVQQTALENVYGGLDRIARADKTRQQSREDSLPHTETTMGRGPAPAATKQPGDDVLKGVSPEYIKFWEKRGYTRDQMIEEAKYVTKVPRKQAARPR